MRSFLRGLLHAVIGGVSVGLAQVAVGSPITLKTVGLPVAVSAATSVWSFVTDPKNVVPVVK